MAHGNARYARSGLYGTIFCLLAVLALASACGVRYAAGPPASAVGAPSFGTTLDAPVPASVLDAPLVDSHGRPTTLGAMRGKVIVLSDVMTLCQESCPIITASMLSAARSLDRTAGGKKVEFVSLTVDPTRDDGRHLTAYRRQFGSIPNWTLLTGRPAVVNHLWNTLGVWRRRTHLKPPLPKDWVTGAALTTDVAHTDEMIVIDAADRFRYEMDGYGNVPPSAIPSRIYSFMDALGRSNVAHPDPGSWTPAQMDQVVRWVLGSPA